MSISVSLFLLSVVLDSILEFFFKGANPSAEEQDDALEDGSEQVNNVVHSFRLQTTSFDKPTFLKYLKVFIPVYLVRASGDPVNDRDI
jgi:Translationally controlled tumour protein